MSRKCEEYLISAMAIKDGEDCPLDPSDVTAHLAECPDCRRELAGMKRLGETLDGLGLIAQPADTWEGVREALPGRANSPVRRLTLFVLAALLPAYKLVDLVADLPAIHVTKLVPIAIAVLVLACLGINPFALSPAPSPEGDAA